MRNRLPHHWIDADDDPETALLLEGLGVDADDLPIVITQGDLLKRATPGHLAQRARLDRRLPARPLLRRRRGRRRARRVGRVGVCRVGRVAHVDDRRCGGRRAGGDELAHRELPRLPDRHLRAGLDVARFDPGPEVRRADHEPLCSRVAGRGRRASRVQPCRRHADRSASDRCRYRRALSKAADRRSRTLRDGRRLLRSDRARGATVRRSSPVDRRRRWELGRAGRDVPRREDVVGVRRRTPPARARRCRATWSIASRPTTGAGPREHRQSRAFTATLSSSVSRSPGQRRTGRGRLHGPVLVHRGRTEQRVVGIGHGRRARLRADRPGPRP